MKCGLHVLTVASHLQDVPSGDGSGEATPMFLGDFCPAGAGRSRTHSPMLVAEWSLGSTRPGWEGDRGMHSAGAGDPKPGCTPRWETEEAEFGWGGAGLEGVHWCGVFGRVVHGLVFPGRGKGIAGVGCVRRSRVFPDSRVPIRVPEPPAGLRTGQDRTRAGPSGDLVSRDGSPGPCGPLAPPRGPEHHRGSYCCSNERFQENCITDELTRVT